MTTRRLPSLLLPSTFTLAFACSSVDGRGDETSTQPVADGTSTGTTATTSSAAATSSTNTGSSGNGSTTTGETSSATSAPTSTTSTSETSSASSSTADTSTSAATSDQTSASDASSNVTSDTTSDSTQTSSDSADPSDEGPDSNKPCVDSQSRNTARGNGPHEVVIETNADTGIKEGTIFRPATLSEDEKWPILVWGEGGCSLNGLSNQDAMVEIASHGYFVIADGTPGNNASRDMNTNDIPGMGKPLIAYIDWVIEENTKTCSPYYHKLNTKKIATNGFSCGGLMAEGTAGDPRITTWGITSSGMFAANQALYDSVHTPVLILLGGASDTAYNNGKRDYENISKLDVPVLYFSKDIGHGGDMFQRGGGDFTKINLAWLNWWLKGDEGATGKGVLVGPTCTYCSNNQWEVMSSNVP